MKIYINRKPKNGPWGGGAKTINKLWATLEDRGHKVVGKLQEDIDVIFCFDPRPNHRGEWYQNFLDYRDLYPGTKIVQRVGDLGTHSKPHLTTLVKQTLGMSDYFIFPSQWSKDWIEYDGENCEVINNAPMKIFYQNRNLETTLSDKISVVTHHWSTNPKKGFDLYQEFEKWCEPTNIDFYYIGQLPPGVQFKNYIKPVSSDVLASALPKFDIYLTASEEEAGANHVLEAMAAGLPILFKDTGGSIVDYCQDYGESYSDYGSMIVRLRNMISNFEKYKKNVLTYDDVNDTVVNRYCKIIEEIRHEN